MKRTKMFLGYLLSIAICIPTGLAFPKHTVTASGRQLSFTRSVERGDSDRYFPAPVSSSSMGRNDKSNQQAGKLVCEIGMALQQTANSQSRHLKPLWEDAGDALLDMGYAWESHDWTAVTYAAQEASLSMELLAKSINDRRTDKNKFQQALAGIAVELQDLSNSKKVPPVALRGLAWHFRQASACVEDKNISAAAKAAHKLSSLHPGSIPSRIIPRRLQGLRFWNAFMARKRKEEEGAPRTD